MTEINNYCTIYEKENINYNDYQAYYFEQMFQRNKLCCITCHKEQKFPLSISKKERDNNIYHKYHNKYITDTNFQYISYCKNNTFSLLIHHNFKSLYYYSWCKLLYKSDCLIDKFMYKLSCSKKIRTNYLNKYLPYLLEILFDNLAFLVLDYYLLYYNHCDECFESGMDNGDIVLI